MGDGDKLVKMSDGNVYLDQGGDSLIKVDSIKRSGASGVVQNIDLINGTVTFNLGSQDSIAASSGINQGSVNDTGIVDSLSKIKSSLYESIGEAADQWSSIDKTGREQLLKESLYLGLNGIGSVAGGLMLALPEPTTATKWLGGALFAKSAAGAALNIANIREAWSGGKNYEPSSLASLITSSSSKEVQAMANVVDLSIDFASGRAVANTIIKHIPQTGKYGTSKNTTVPYTLQHKIGKPASALANTLSIGQSSIIINDSVKSIQKDLR
ncbi:hypothetical protein S4054_07645 [Pseudoalteromonas luteoviolacea]|nr:hypothetical protein S4054_07645 [Pseudoalteromonas luteoviolacea]